MKKNISIIFGMLFSTITIACDVKKDEQLVCEALMCTIGIAIPASHSECLKVQTEFAIYLATLGFWENPPKCKNRDMNCQVTGKANANVSPSTCNAVSSNPTDFVNCEVQASKLVGQTFNCSKYADNPTLRTACEQQFQSNGINPNLDGDYTLDPRDRRNSL
ncbi:hypothetical protein [Microbulbifer discodermiae]|uniref:hypothetical protein n=1 Tax=Microbulbifer sp. 2201CG32-9 TaxID=3232309 RepID=UPI00345BCF02